MSWLKRKIKKLLIPIAYAGARVYWFIFRPTYRGAKIVLTHGDQILLIRHRYGAYYWTFTGGRVENGEMPEQAVIRETKEELGINLAKVVATGSFFMQEEYKKDTIYCFWAETNSQEIHPDEIEIAEARWFPKNALPEKLGENAKRILAAYQNHSTTSQVS